MTSFQATLVNSGFGQLVLRDSLGKVAQKWTLSNPKCVIGTGTNCNVSCQLPGIGDHHVLMVIGAKQVFIRALAPGLTHNGQNINELVIPSNQSDFNFEIAGHHFQFSREGVSTPVNKEFVKELVQDVTSARPLFAKSCNDAPSTTAPPEIVPVKMQDQSTLAPMAAAENTPSSLALVPSRLKFTVVRALEKNRQAHSDSPSMMDNSLSTGRPAWVEAIVRDALRPVEERLDELNGPLQSIERRLRRQRTQLRKAQQQAQTNLDNSPSQPQFVPVLAPELIQSQAVIEQYVQKHTSQLDRVTQSVGQIVTRLSDVDGRLNTTQAERQALSEQFQQSNTQIASLQREMIQLLGGLQTQLSQPVQTSTSTEARLWQTNVEAQLAELQATLLALDDIKQTLHMAVEQNRSLKGDIELQQQRLGKLVAESTQKAVADALAQTSTDSETIGQIVGDKVCDSLREQLGTRFTNEIAQQLTDSLNHDFAQPLSDQLSSQLQDQAAGKVADQVADQVCSKINGAVAGQLSEQLSGNFSQQISSHLSNQLADQFSSQISSQISNHLSGELTRQFANAPQPQPASLSSEEIVQALRSTLNELLAPLANTLQSGLQQTIQQAVDQSMQQSVEQTIAPMIEAATSAQIRAVAALPSWQLPSVTPNSVPPAEPARPQAIERPTYQPAIEPPVSAVNDSQAYEHPIYEQPSSEPAYEQATYTQPAYEQGTYEQPAFEQPADTSQGFDSQPYQPPGYESRAYAAPAEPQAYEPQAYEPQVNDSQAYDSQVTDEAVEQQPMDSHAQELPSWWSDDPVAVDPRAEAYPESADHDGLPAGAQPTYDSTYRPEAESEAQDPYAQSAFSAEQLELGSNADDNYDSVPYSELVNRKPVDFAEDAYDQPAQFNSDYAPYDSQSPELVTAGASADYPADSYQELPSEPYADIAQPDHLTQSVPAADNPTVPASAANQGEDTDESVEDYMRRLLARMRGVSEGDVTLPSAEATKPASAVVPKDPSVAQPAAMTTSKAEGEQLSEAWTEPFDPDNYVPRGSAPEKNRDLNALRELANTSARSAIQVSARRRQGSAILIKSAIALVGLIAGIALVSINGARINIAFIATVASFLVAVIWGYDASTSIRPLLQANRQQSNQKRESDKAAKAEEAEEAAQ